ncbi:telomerase-binding protein EST1A isoform X1 [Seriola lalandi dorsalis]|uniref:telomerase-binding protein EST1A n=2 Tax=Seriola TaxID=8160 RepID=UPI000C6F4EB5|nr:telomerase-binding protein EST1A isoform X1 [Seriola lalandi dorsalis]XP_056253254.1 telomerase-binding protein EST1A [Seriola aureovittata]
MANELDRVRISAAELRAEASNTINTTDCQKEEQHVLKQHKRREGKRPDLQRYQPVAGHGRRHRDSEEGEPGQSDPLATFVHEHDEPSQSEKKGLSEKVLECTDGMGTDKKEEDRMRGDNSNTQNCRMGSHSQAKMEENQEKGFVENHREHQEPAGAAKPARKARKPDREFYQPGSRRNIQGKDCGVGREQDKPPSKKHEQKTEPESQLSTGEIEGNKKTSTQKRGGKGKEVKGTQENVKLSKSSETNGKQGNRDVQKPPLPSDASVEKITSKVEKLNVKEKVKVVCEGQDVEELSCRRGETTDKGRRGQGGGTKEEEEKMEKKKEKGNRRRRGGEKEKERNQDSRRGEDDISGVGKSDQCKVEKEKDRRAAEADRDNKPGKTGEAHQIKGRENCRESRRGDNNNNNRSREAEKDAKSEKNVDRTVVDRNKSNANITSSSKRYSKSDIRRSRNRTYSSSSTSSVTSLDGPGLGMDVESTKWPRLQPKHSNKEEIANSGEGRRSHLRSWTTNGESSTESMEGSEMSDITEDRRRRRRGGEEELSTARRREERNRPKGNKGGGRGILRVSLEKHSGISSHSGDVQHCKPGLVPRGRGGGILVLPARTDISNSPEVGQRLLFGGIRGGAAGSSRGGRGGGVRRLWDPNNPDQKPALTSTQSSQHKSLQQPIYLQTGTGYGPLNFLDTDDEVAGSPPVPQGEHFRSQQAATMAYYKFQNSDNPYCYPMSTNPGTTTSQRYPYSYHMGPYQMAPPNGMYPGAGVGQFCGSYRGAGYSQPSGGGGLTFEEVEQQARGELGKLLRAADAQELQLSNLLSRDRVSADGLDRMAQLRADLLGLYEQVILTDIELSDSQNVDQALWKNVFYQVIEHFRQLLKDPAYDNTPHIRNMLLTLLDEGALFFDALLQKLQTVYQFKLEDYMDGMAIRARPLRKTVKYALISAQRCMICQGDIARYREQASDSANYGKARSWYLKAQQIAPKNGRPYNQLALLAVYTKRKLDAVYYYMRSLAASNPILTAKESLMSLFEEAKRKTEQLERRRRQEQEGGSRGPAVRGRGRGEEGARVEIWIRPSGQAATPSSQRGGSESSRDSEQDGELGSLSASDLNKRFILSFLHAHGKLFTKVGMESFPGVASRVLQEFRSLLQHGPSLLGSTHMLQIITINMFTIHNAHSRGEEGEVRSVLQEQSTALGLGMFALLVQRCTELLRDIPAEPVPMADGEEEGGKGEELDGMVRVSAFPLDLRELLPSIKVWSDWMLGHPDQWNPPPCSIDCSPDVWQCLADLCNLLARVDHGELPLYKVDTDEVEGDEELTVLQLKEDRLLAGFVPLLAAPQEPCYTDRHTEMAIAADCKRVTVLKYFLEALCGQEEPLLAFKGGKYISVATSPSPNHSVDTRSRQDSLTEKEADDVIVEAESSLSASEGEEDAEEAGDSENDIRQLKARRHALANKLAQQQKRRDKIQAVLQTGGQLELEVRPLFLVPDTNGFVDHLEGLKKLLQCGTYIIVVPLIVITELDGLAKGQDNFGGGVGSGGRNIGTRGNYNVSVAHVRSVQEKARLAVAFLEKGFEAREPCLRALTSRGNQLESIAFRSEDTSGQQGNNDDVILSCCLHYCKDKAKDFMPDQRNGTVRLQREVVLLTDDRNLRVKALTRNVPVRDIPAFLSWAKVG